MNESGYKSGPTRTGHRPDGPGIRERPTRRWSVSLDRDCRRITTPVIADGLLHVGTARSDATGSAVGFRLHDRTVAYRHELPREVRFAPHVRSDRVYVGTLGGELRALSVPDGVAEWTVDTEEAPVSPPAVADSMAHVVDVRGRASALRVDTGTPAWRFRTGGTVQSGTTVSEDAVFVGTATGELVAIDVRRGTERWRCPLDGGILAVPAVSNRSLYVPRYDGAVHAIDATDGTERWRHSVGPLATTPASTDETVYVVDREGCVHALASRSGTVRWRATVRGEVASSPTVAGGVLYVRQCGGTVSAFDAVTGESLWEYDGPPARTDSPVVAADDRLYLAGRSRVVALS